MAKNLLNKKLQILILAALFTATFIGHAISHENHGKDSCQICRLSQSMIPQQPAVIPKPSLPYAQLIVPSVTLLSFEFSYLLTYPRAPPSLPL